MINVNTVLILGAGASKPFGFPTGAELVRDICDMLESADSEDFQTILRLHKRAREIKRFRNGLNEAKPRSVDAWLEHNREFLAIGKNAIACAILKRENRSNFGVTDNWYDLLFEALNCPVDQFGENRVAIVTFNYDRSLEYYLHRKLLATYTPATKRFCEEQLNKIPIVHVYGCLGPVEWEDRRRMVAYGEYEDEDIIGRAAENIRIMSDKGNEDEGGYFGEAHELLRRNVRAIYYFGFGFDPTNLERLVPSLCFPGHKVLGTCYGLSYQRKREVEKISSRRLVFYTRDRQSLIDSKIYDFIHKYIDWNETGRPASLPPYYGLWDRV